MTTWTQEGATSTSWSQVSGTESEAGIDWDAGGHWDAGGTWDSSIWTLEPPQPSVEPESYDVGIPYDAANVFYDNTTTVPVWFSEGPYAPTTL